MGKTAVLLAVVELPVIKERFPGTNIIWVPCIEATSVTSLLEILYTQLQVPGNKQVMLEKIISELDASKQPHPAGRLRSTVEWAWQNSETGQRYSSKASHAPSRCDPCYDAWHIPTVRRHRMAIEDDPAY